MYETGNLGFRSPRVFKSGTSTPNSSAKGWSKKKSTIKLGRYQHNQQYHPQHKLIRNSVYYDGINPAKDQSFQQSIPTNRSQQFSTTSYSQQKSLRESQYSGFAGNQRKRLQHQVGVLNKQIERLRKEIQQKDRLLSEASQGKVQLKEVEMELVETYRVINYYEGKINEQEKIVSYLQGVVSERVGDRAKGKLKDGLDFKEIIQFFRTQSIQLKGQLQRANHQNTKLHLTISKLQTKCLNLSKQLSQKQAYSQQYQALQQKQKVASIYQAKLQSSQNKIAQRKGDDEVSLTGSVRSQGSQKSLGFSQKGMAVQNRFGQGLGQEQQGDREYAKMYGNFSSKVNKIEKELDFFRVENEKIFAELNEKLVEIGNLVRENDQLRYMLNNNQHYDQQSTKTVQFQKPSQQKNDLSQFITSLPQDFMTKKKPSQQQQTTAAQKQLKPNFSSQKQKQKPLPIKPRQSPSPDKRRQQIKGMSLNQISRKIQQTKTYKFKDILPQTVRKLRYNLIREDVTYGKLVEMICDKLTSPQDPNSILQELQDMPYQLSSKESSQFLFQYKKILAYMKQRQQQSNKNANQPDKDLTQQQKSRQIKQQLKEILKENIPSFKNITLRRDAALTGQLTKNFKNRLAEVEPYLRDRKKALMEFAQAEKILRDQWGLGDEEVQFVMLKSCEETQNYSKFDFYKTIHFFLEN